jgi:hypothetical protein
MAKALRLLLLAVILGLVVDMPGVVIGMASKCEIKLAWGKYLDVTDQPWAADWVKKCKEGPANIMTTDTSKMKFDPTLMNTNTDLNRR